jgi:hypothetical protein
MCHRHEELATLRSTAGTATAIDISDIELEKDAKEMQDEVEAKVKEHAATMTVAVTVPVAVAVAVMVVPVAVAVAVMVAAQIEFEPKETELTPPKTSVVAAEDEEAPGAAQTELEKINVGQTIVVQTGENNQSAELGESREAAEAQAQLEKKREAAAQLEKNEAKYQLLIANMGLEDHHVAAAGDCLFLALMYMMHLLSILPQGYSTVTSTVEHAGAEYPDQFFEAGQRARQEVCDCLQGIADNPGAEDYFCIAEDATAYIAKARLDGEWSGEPEVAAAARLLKVRIVTYTLTSDEIDGVARAEYPPRAGDEAQATLIVSLRSGHYWPTKAVGTGKKNAVVATAPIAPETGETETDGGAAPGEEETAATAVPIAPGHGGLKKDDAAASAVPIAPETGGNTQF